jgi:hypothetical protein
MPKVKLSFASPDAIPAELKSFAGADNTVEIWTGSQETVAAELNPGLEANRNALKTEKEQLQSKYDNLLKSSSETSQQLQEANVKLASNTGVSPDDLKLLNTVKQAAPGMKPEDIKNTLTAFPNVNAELTTLKADRENAEIFGATGFKNQKVFVDLLGNKTKNPNLEKVVVKEEKVDDKPVKKAYANIKQADGTIKEIAFDEYVKSNPEWSPYMPSLSDTASQATWIQQQGGGAGGGGGTPPTSGEKSPLDLAIEQANQKSKAIVNPLRPATPTPATTEVKQN